MADVGPWDPGKGGLLAGFWSILFIEVPLKGSGLSDNLVDGYHQDLQCDSISDS